MSRSGADPLFDGPGEVRAMLRSVDWADTPLGPVPGWSPALRVSLQMILRSDFPMVIGWGPELIALYNDAFAGPLAGLHPAALGRPMSQVWGPVVWEWVGPRYSRAFTQGQTVAFVDEMEILRRKGYEEECYFTFSLSPVLEVDGTIGGVIAISSETTAVKVAERHNKVLRALGALSAVDTGGLAGSCRAAAGVLATARESVPFAALFLTGPGEQPRVPIAEYGFTAGAFAPGTAAGVAGRVHEVVARVAASGKPEVLTGVREDCGAAVTPGPLGPLLPDGAVVLPLAVSGSTDPVGAALLGVNPYQVLNADYQGFFASAQQQIRVLLSDSAALRTERQRLRMVADLDRAKAEFYQNVSHELRTPLTLLLAPLQDLLAGVGDDPGAIGEDLRSAVRAAERLRVMVDALLDFSGAQGGLLAPDLRPADLATATTEVTGMFRSTAEHAGLELLVQVPESPVTAVVDRSMWATIVTNLVSNAVKYTEHGQVRVQLAPAGRDAVLTVADTGIGISDEQQLQIFDRFYRAAPEDRSPGAGIGLALVVDLVRAHHGQIQVSSALGRGTNFTIRLPLGVYPVPGPDSADGGDDTNAAFARRVLVVEDDADLRGYLRRLLISDGWAVDAAPDAETALSTALSGSGSVPDLVLTDVMLPGRSGLYLVGQLRRAPATARVPIIILTARAGPDATGEGLAVGADDYLTKPFSSRELLARIRSNHELHQLREQAITTAETRAQQVHNALDSNRIIGTAVGIVMASYQLTAEQSFRLLTTASQNTNRKLRDIAAAVTEQGTLPFRPTDIDDLLIRTATTSRT